MKDRASSVNAPRIKWLVEPTYDDDGVQRTAGIDQFGREHGDPVPLRPPVGLNVEQGDELHTALRNLLQRERALFRAMVEAEQFESEEDANDFITEDDLFPPGNEPWEDVHEFPAEPSSEMRSEPAASQRAPNGQNRAPDEATAQPPNQRASSDFLPERKMETKVETPISGDSDRMVSQGSHNRQRQ